MFREISKDIVSKKQEDTVNKWTVRTRQHSWNLKIRQMKWKKVNMRIVDKNLVILHEKEQKQKEDN